MVTHAASPKMVTEIYLADHTVDNGDQYLRVCDSIRVVAAQTQHLLSIHGTNDVFFEPVTCNYDGSFARVQIRNNRYAVHKNIHIIMQT